MDLVDPRRKLRRRDIRDAVPTIVLLLRFSITDPSAATMAALKGSAKRSIGEAIFDQRRCRPGASVTK